MYPPNGRNGLEWPISVKFYENIGHIDQINPISAILSIDYNPSNATFAYSAGKSIYLWKWSSNYKEIRKVFQMIHRIFWHNYRVNEMAERYRHIKVDESMMSHVWWVIKTRKRCLTVMEGHLSEVISLRWHSFMKRWVSGGDDGQLRNTVKS